MNTMQEQSGIPTGNGDPSQEELSLRKSRNISRRGAAILFGAAIASWFLPKFAFADVGGGAWGNANGTASPGTGFGFDNGWAVWTDGTGWVSGSVNVTCDWATELYYHFVVRMFIACGGSCVTDWSTGQCWIPEAQPDTNLATCINYGHRDCDGMQNISEALCNGRPYIPYQCDLIDSGYKQVMQDGYTLRRKSSNLWAAFTAAFDTYGFDQAVHNSGNNLDQDTSIGQSIPALQIANDTSLRGKIVRLIPYSSGAHCLDVASDFNGVGTTNNSVVQLWQYYGSTSQNYYVGASNGGLNAFAPIHAINNGQYLDQTNGRCDENAAVETYTGNGSMAQDWWCYNLATYNGVDYSPVFNFLEYYARYTDLQSAFGLDAHALLDHFVNHGIPEGRIGNNKFDWMAYKARYADLQAAYGNNPASYYMHWINNGRAEGRIGGITHAATDCWLDVNYDAVKDEVDCIFHNVTSNFAHKPMDNASIEWLTQKGGTGHWVQMYKVAGTDDWSCKISMASVSANRSIVFNGWMSYMGTGAWCESSMLCRTTSTGDCGLYRIFNNSSGRSLDMTGTRTDPVANGRGIIVWGSGTLSNEWNCQTSWWEAVEVEFTGTITLDGTKMVGQPLTVSDPKKTCLPYDAFNTGTVKYVYRFYRGASAFACSTLVQAESTSATYTPTADDIGQWITCAVELTVPAFNTRYKGTLYDSKQIAGKTYTVEYYTDGESTPCYKQTAYTPTVTLDLVEADAAARKQGCSRFDGWYTSDAYAAISPNSVQVSGSGTLKLYGRNFASLVYENVCKEVDISTAQLTAAGKSGTLSNLSVLPDVCEYQYGTALTLAQPSSPRLAFEDGGRTRWLIAQSGCYFTKECDGPAVQDLTIEIDTTVYKLWSRTTYDGIKEVAR
jgi:hypothetical protein